MRPRSGRQQGQNASLSPKTAKRSEVEKTLEPGGFIKLFKDQLKDDKSSLTDVVVFCALLNHTHSGTDADRCRISQAKLAGELGINTRTVRRSLKALEQAGYIQRTSRGKNRGCKILSVN